MTRDRGQAERFAAYCELRREGKDQYEAGSEIGIADSTRRNYERSWVAVQGLPRREAAQKHKINHAWDGF